MSIFVAGRRSGRPFGPLILIAVGSVLGMAILPFGSLRADGNTPDHLVISEIATGGASASDEFVELYNPGPDALPLEGLELVYVSASGLSVSRRAAWQADAPEVPAGHHVLIANELGIYAPIADVLYASGMAATGGSVALRIQGAGFAVDAVGWGSAVSTWLEGQPAVAPAAGASIERLPGGAFGSTQDTDDNLADFVERPSPEPQNAGSSPTPDQSQPSPTAAPSPTPVPSAPTAPPPAESATPAPTSSPTAVSVAAARALPAGTSVTVEATALTASTFAEGGGYVADASGGIAVLLSSGSFDRGSRLRVSGIVDDRFAQRTIRSSGSQVTVLGTGPEPEPLVRATGEIGEPVEAVVVRITGSIVGSPTSLSAGLAFNVDDGSGAVRVVVGSGIATDAWSSGTVIDLVGIVGQRDSSGTGVSGYRVQPRDSSDVIGIGPPSATATPVPSNGATPMPDGVTSIADARAAPKHTRVRVRGTVTLVPGTVDPISAVIQDATAAILLRVADEVGSLTRGERVEVEGVRSTLSGMETLRVTRPALRLGAGAEPDPIVVRTGDAGEALEAALVSVRGAVVASARRFSSGTVSFEVDDGSGPLRVYLAAALGGDPADLTAGTWVTVTGVLGQETSGAQPLRGYRVWPRTTTEIVVMARPAEEAGAPAAAGDDHDPAGGVEPVASLARVGGPDLAGLRIGATLVHGQWDELKVAGLLWDGERLVAIDRRSAEIVARLLRGRVPPLLLELGGLRATGSQLGTAIPTVALGAEPGDVVVRDGPAAPADAELPDRGLARWVSLLGRISGSRNQPVLRVGSTEARIERRCDDAAPLPGGLVSVTGIGLASPARIVVPCTAIRPAPALGRAALHRVLATAATGSIEPPAAAAPPAEESSSTRVPAASLLAAAALALAGGAAAVRWRGGGGGGMAQGPSGDADPPGESQAEPGPRSLALVRVPRERGSP